jgi:hypothetical protein
VAALGHLARAQVTTANLRGTVKGEDGVPIAEVEVTLIHEPSGNEKQTTTNSDGEFAFTGLRVGGPYHLIAKQSGFKDAQEKGIELEAVKTRDVEITMRLQEEVIEVESNAITRTTSGRTVITAEEIDSLPSVSRDPRDMVRRTPEVVVSGKDHVMSIGGMNPRFNSITIDGIRLDDDFGLNQSGYPTRRSPIPLAAIEQMVVEQNPFDVRYGKFLGGNVNIITKSGTNDIHGNIFATYTSDGLIGHQSATSRVDSTTGLPLNTDLQPCRTVNGMQFGTCFHEYRYGAEIAGPIVKDKLHFIVALEGLSATTPESIGAQDSGAANSIRNVTNADVAAVQQISQSAP